MLELAQKLVFICCPKAGKTNRQDKLQKRHVFCWCNVYAHISEEALFQRMSRWYSPEH